MGIPSSQMIIRNAVAAAAPTIFIKYKDNGDIDWDATNGSLTVYVNKRYPDGKGGLKDASEKHTLRVPTSLCPMAANFIYPGKPLNQLVIGLSQTEVDEAGKNGKTYKKQIDHKTIMSIDLGGDSQGYIKDMQAGALRAAKEQGTLHDGMSLDDIIAKIPEILALAARNNKPKTKPFDLSEAKRTGKWVYAELWDEKNQKWNSNGTIPAEQNNTDVANYIKLAVGTGNPTVVANMGAAIAANNMAFANSLREAIISGNADMMNAVSAAFMGAKASEQPVIDIKKIETADPEPTLAHEAGAEEPAQDDQPDNAVSDEIPF